MVGEIDLQGLDIVIIYRETINSDELRYCLRSLAKNLPHRNIIISGDLPEWCTNVIHIPQPEKTLSTFHDQNLKIRNACLDDRVSYSFVFFNDDMFCMDQIKSIPNWYISSLQEDADRRSGGKRSTNKYVNGMLNTKKHLQGLNLDEPFSYELHLPMIINKQDWLRAYDTYKDHRWRESQPIFHRSVYGNLFYSDNVKRKDVKYIKKDEDYPKDSDFLSTLQSRFNNTPVGEYIKSKFPDKSKYEI